MNEPAKSNLVADKSGVPRETIVGPDETRALKEIGRAVAGFLKG
jgi:hypothetical protein